jgi:hypothetical protein
VVVNVKQLYFSAGVVVPADFGGFLAGVL